ncbi:Hypp3725 [Branchiostoma lanceolatum]|uniref:Hypp3725 protein n=1 Tax=Branchiostoma lanceolatum TaxID=7740 RepID=A0A8K0A4C9_BRALA|nr:Hypp3725 [Branchiostoma lanceolatum]
MKVSVLLLAMLVLLAASTAAIDIDDVKNKKDAREFLKQAKNKVAAAKEIHAKLVSLGRAKQANKFMKRAKSVIRRRRKQNKDD